jgi:hypothetical protein
VPQPQQTSLGLASADTSVYVRVVPEIALDKAFDYVLPLSLKGKVLPGHRVRVPWGKKSVLAYVVDFPEKPEVARCREVEALAGDEPLIPPPLLTLAKWMAGYYCCDLPQVLKMMLPGVVRQKEDAYKKQLWVTVPDHLVPEEVDATLGRATAQKKAWHATRAKGGGFLAVLCRELKTTAATFHALADFVAPVGSGRKDYVGAFAVTSGHGCEALCADFEKAQDDYSSILVKAIADRFAEASAEWLHAKVRREWGYGRAEALSTEDLIEEKYRGIRPAPGYPACPDHTEKLALFDWLGAREAAGMDLTESFAMTPAASVGGLYFAHPEARYFAVDRITREQVEDYAGRKGMTVAEVERWLAPNLGYDPS